MIRKRKEVSLLLFVTMSSNALFLLLIGAIIFVYAKLLERISKVNDIILEECSSSGKNVPGNVTFGDIIGNVLNVPRNAIKQDVLENLPRQYYPVNKGVCVFISDAATGVGRETALMLADSGVHVLAGKNCD